MYFLFNTARQVLQKHWILNTVFLYPSVKVECCGADSPQDWIEYNSTYKAMFGTVYPWPKQCCKRLSNSDVEDPDGCKLGLTSTMFTKVGYAVTFLRVSPHHSKIAVCQNMSHLRTGETQNRSYFCTQNNQLGLEPTEMST